MITKRNTVCRYVAFLKIGRSKQLFMTILIDEICRRKNSIEANLSRFISSNSRYSIPHFYEIASAMK